MDAFDLITDLLIAFGLFMLGYRFRQYKEKREARLHSAKERGIQL